MYADDEGTVGEWTKLDEVRRGVDTLMELLGIPLELGVELAPPRPILPDGPNSKHLDSTGAVISCAGVS